MLTDWECTQLLDRMDEGGTLVDCDWQACRELIAKALAALDASGHGHSATARSLSDALATAEQQLFPRQLLLAA